MNKNSNFRNIVAISVLIGVVFLNFSPCFALMAGKYKCAGADDACSLTKLTVESFESCASRAYIDGAPNTNCADLTVSGCGPTEGNVICKYEPPFLIHVDGTYSKSSEVGTFKILGNLIDFSESKIRGTGVITENQNLITFTYINPFNTIPGKEVAQQRYQLVPGTEEGLVTGSGTGTGTKSLKTPVEVQFRGNADGFVDPEKGDRARFTFTPQTSGKVNIRVFTPQSEEIDSASYDVTAGVASTIFWDGRANDGGKSPVASGIYIVRIEGPDFKVTKKIAVVK